MRLNTLTFEGARLSQARKARGLTAVTLADVAGITSAAISRYEHSKDTPRGEIHQMKSAVLNGAHCLQLQNRLVSVAKYDMTG